MFIFIAMLAFNLIDIDTTVKKRKQFCWHTNSVHILFRALCVCERTCEPNINTQHTQYDFLRRHHHNIYIFQFKQKEGPRSTVHSSVLETTKKIFRSDIDVKTRYIYFLLAPKPKIKSMRNIDDFSKFEIQLIFGSFSFCVPFSTTPKKLHLSYP